MFKKKSITHTAIIGRFMGLSMFLMGCCIYVSAASFNMDGDKKKDTKKDDTPVNLAFSNLKSTLQLSLRPTAAGFQYKGNLVTEQQTTNNVLSVRSLMTYQKGNTIYILPYKQQFLLTKFKTPERELK